MRELEGQDNEALLGIDIVVEHLGIGKAFLSMLHASPDASSCLFSLFFRNGLTGPVLDPPLQ